jgi:hypothetical protein
MVLQFAGLHTLHSKFLLQRMHWGFSTELSVILVNPHYKNASLRDRFFAEAMTENNKLVLEIMQINLKSNILLIIIWKTNMVIFWIVHYVILH